MMVPQATYETVFVRRKFIARDMVAGQYRSKMPEYRIWCGMIARCSNEKHKNFHRYGGRGVDVCRPWREDFANFFRDMGPRPTAKHSIDRIDNDGNYEPSNCRWATPREQMLNRNPAHSIWTDSDYATLRRMYSRYYSVEEIAVALDRSAATIRLHIHNEKLRRENFLTRLANQNPDLRHILHSGDREGFLQAVTARKELRAKKVKSQRQAALREISERAQEILRTSESRNAKMRLMREAGMSLSDVGKHFGITRERVRQLQEAGFPEDEGHATGDRRKVSKTNPEVRRKKIDRLCRAWNAASREARIAFVAAAPFYLFREISVEHVEPHHASPKARAA